MSRSKTASSVSEPETRMLIRGEQIAGEGGPLAVENPYGGGAAEPPRGA